MLLQVRVERGERVQQSGFGAVAKVADQRL